MHSLILTFWALYSCTWTCDLVCFRDGVKVTIADIITAWKYGPEITPYLDTFHAVNK